MEEAIAQKSHSNCRQNETSFLDQIDSENRLVNLVGEWTNNRIGSLSTDCWWPSSSGRLSRLVSEALFLLKC